MLQEFSCDLGLVEEDVVEGLEEDQVSYYLLQEFSCDLGLV